MRLVYCSELPPASLAMMPVRDVLSEKPVPLCVSLLFVWFSDEDFFDVEEGYDHQYGEVQTEVLADR